MLAGLDRPYVEPLPGIFFGKRRHLYRNIVFAQGVVS
jgi:hypothetical protein